MGDNKSDMIEQIKELSHERQFADQRYEETAEFLRQKEAELARVETLLAESVTQRVMCMLKVEKVTLQRNSK